jgi:hypothetical protein
LFCAIGIFFFNMVTHVTSSGQTLEQTVLRQRLYFSTE